MLHRIGHGSPHYEHGECWRGGVLVEEDARHAVAYPEHGAPNQTTKRFPSQQKASVLLTIVLVLKGCLFHMQWFVVGQRLCMLRAVPTKVALRSLQA